MSDVLAYGFYYAVIGTVIFAVGLITYTVVAEIVEWRKRK